MHWTFWLGMGFIVIGLILICYGAWRKKMDRSVESMQQEAFQDAIEHRRKIAALKKRLVRRKGANTDGLEKL